MYSEVKLFYFIIGTVNVLPQAVLYSYFDFFSKAVIKDNIQYFQIACPQLRLFIFSVIIKEYDLNFRAGFDVTVKNVNTKVTKQKAAAFVSRREDATSQLQTF